MKHTYIPELPKHIHDEKNGLDYTLHGDYYLPDLGVEPGYPLAQDNQYMQSVVFFRNYCDN